MLKIAYKCCDNRLVRISDASLLAATQACDKTNKASVCIDADRGGSY